MVATPKAIKPKRSDICITCLRQEVCVTESAFYNTKGWSAEDLGKYLTKSIQHHDAIAFWCDYPGAPLMIARFMMVEECLECFDGSH